MFTLKSWIELHIDLIDKRIGITVLEKQNNNSNNVSRLIASILPLKVKVLWNHLQPYQRRIKAPHYRKVLYGLFCPPHDSFDCEASVTEVEKISKYLCINSIKCMPKSIYPKRFHHLRHSHTQRQREREREQELDDSTVTNARFI